MIVKPKIHLNLSEIDTYVQIFSYIQNMFGFETTLENNNHIGYTKISLVL